MSRVTVIVVSWNTAELLDQCLASVAATTHGMHAEVIVVDNGSSDSSVAMVRERFPAARLIQNSTNVGFGCANNQAAASSRAPYLLLLNSDAVLLPQTLEKMLSLTASHPSAAVVGARVLNPDRSFQASHVCFPGLWQQLLVVSGIGRLLIRRQYPSCDPGTAVGSQPVDWVSGACMLVRTDAFAAVGGFDPAYFLYGEEMDLCFRLRQAGWEIWYEPNAVVIHHGGGSQTVATNSTREAMLYRGVVRFFRKHYGARQAALLSAEILAATAAKSLVHTVLRAASRARFGRTVIPLPLLWRELRDEVGRA